MAVTLTREVLIFVDAARSGGPDAALNGKQSTAKATPHAFMAGDKCPLKIYMRSRDAGNGASTALDLPSGSTIIVAGRKSSGDILFLSSSFSPSGATTDDSCMAGVIDLNTTEIVEAMGQITYGGSIDMIIDIEWRDASDTERLTYRIMAKLYRQVYAGEITPSGASAAPILRTSPDGGIWQMGVSNDGQTTWTKVA